MIFAAFTRDSSSTETPTQHLAFHQSISVCLSKSSSARFHCAVLLSCASTIRKSRLHDAQGPDRSDGKASSSTEEQARSTLERLRVLQSHLCSYVQRSVPVVKVDLANFSDTLDRLHDYLLLCIQMAMEQDEADVHEQTASASTEDSPSV